MNRTLKSFLALPDRDRRDMFEAAAGRLDTPASYVEKDLWVCLVLEALYSRLPGGHPRLLFGGAASLSKAFGLIRRFSEDIDLLVHRDDLGFGGAGDPAIAEDLSGRERTALFGKLNMACGSYVLGDLATELAALMGHLADGCRARTKRVATGKRYSSNTPPGIRVAVVTTWPRG